MTMLLTGRAQSTLINQIHHAELFTLCDWLYEAGIRVDMILADLPYGTTACSWDEVIAFEPMWQRFKRVIMPRGAIVLTASQPFTSRLVCSNLAMFRYEWVWRKNRGSNYAITHLQPMKEHDCVLVFSDATPQYFPQMIARAETGQARAKYLIRGSNTGKRQAYNGMLAIDSTIKADERVPSSVLDFNVEVGLHPTQKPVALFEYLIRTYTRAGDLVLDPCVGSGTTALAARNTQRQYVCGDSSAKYVQVARNRLAQPYTLPLFAEATA